MRSVHPRTRGEHKRHKGKSSDGPGSSPHARGTRCRGLCLQPYQRFIPARAGNTTAQRRKSRACTVHPRTRGEHRSVHLVRLASSGSSPHARGTRRLVLRGCSKHPVHPRTRGEHHAIHSPSQFHLGSSPHARGTRPDRLRMRAWSRFIPARAGNTPLKTRSRKMSTVHPRTRGEH